MLKRHSIPNPFEERELAISRLGGMEDLYNKHVELFKRNYNECDIMLSQLIEESRYDEARTFVHSLKGLASTLGMKDLHLKAKDIEMSIKEGRFNDLPLLLAHFKTSLKLIIQSNDDDHSSSCDGTVLCGL